MENGTERSSLKKRFSTCLGPSLIRKAVECILNINRVYMPLIYELYKVAILSRTGKIMANSMELKLLFVFTWILK